MMFHNGFGRGFAPAAAMPSPSTTETARSVHDRFGSPPNTASVIPPAIHRLLRSRIIVFVDSERSPKERRSAPSRAADRTHAPVMRCRPATAKVGHHGHSLDHHHRLHR